MISSVMPLLKYSSADESRSSNGSTATEALYAASAAFAATLVVASALPVAYGCAPQQHWAAFAQFVLDAAYEATMLEAVINARRGAANIVLLTSLGGGAFGNAPEWIHAAVKRAVKKVQDFDIDVRLRG